MMASLKERHADLEGWDTMNRATKDDTAWISNKDLWKTKQRRLGTCPGCPPTIPEPTPAALCATLVLLLLVILALFWRRISTHPQKSRSSFRQAVRIYDEDSEIDPYFDLA